jgi:hypothetical protein
MRTAGVSNLWVIVHQWQNAGYDNEYPDVLPARAAWGGNAGLQALGQTIRDAGYLFSLHENYVDFYTNAPSWNVNDVSRNSDGSLRPGWYNSFTGVQSYQMKPSRYASYLTNFAAQIHNTFTTTASYLDVHSAVNPTYWVDFDSAVTNAGMFVETLQRNRALAGLLRDIHQGPVSGEGNCHFLTVGYYDDIEAQINSGGGYNVPKTQGQWLPLLVDFELLKLHDKACTHGVGYYERFFADETNTPKFLQYQKDAVLQYIATELAYGHGGFIPTGDRVYFLNEVALLEQRHVLPAQQLYAFARPVSILYGDTNDEVTASTYISRYPTTYANISNANFMAQVRVTYDNGAVVCVNRHPSRQWQVQLGHPGGTFNFHAVLNGSNTLGVVKTNLTSYLLPVRNGWVVFAPDWTPPVISSATVTSGIISLNVTNLLPGCSNRVERCLSLESNTWQTVDTFLSSDVQTNWSHPVSNDWTRAFYRVVRFW